MKRFFIITLCLGWIIFLSTNAFSAILLAEVANDPTWGGDPEGEYIIVCNTGASSVNIKDYSFVDNSPFANRVFITTVNYFLPSEKCILVIRDEPDGVDVFGPSRYNCGALPPAEFRNAGTWGNNFGNSATGDQVYLFDSTATSLADAIDSMSYGTNSVVFPSGTLPTSGGSGRVFRRTNYPSNIAALGTPTTPTDWQTFNPVVTSADYGAGVTPCSIPISPTAADATISGRVTNNYGNGINHVEIIATNIITLEEKRVFTNQFGYYSLTDLESGNFYIVRAVHKRYNFPNVRTVSLLENAEDMDFVPEAFLTK